MTLAEPQVVESGFDDAPEASRAGAAQASARRLAAAEEAIAWLFTGAAAAIGFSARSLEGGGGGLVWDDARIAALHLSKRTPARRRSAQKFRRIGFAAAAMSQDDFEVASLAFTPKRLAPEIRIAFTVRDWCLAGLCAARSPLAETLRDRKRPDIGVWEYLEWECISLNAAAKKVPPRLVRVRDEGEVLLDAMVVRFADLLDERDVIIAKEHAIDEAVRQKRLEDEERARRKHAPSTLDEQIAACSELYERMVHGGSVQ